MKTTTEPYRRLADTAYWRTSMIACAMSGVIACATLGSGCATSPSAHPTDRAVDWSTSDVGAIDGTHESTDRLIIVTFEAQPRRGLPSPGSTAGRYRGGGEMYKSLPASDRTSSKLAESYGLVRVDDWPIALLDVHCVVYSVPGDAPITDLIRQIEADARVKTVQPLHEFEVLGQYDDPYLPHQTGLRTMRIEDAHAWATGDGVKVALIDTGVDLDHPDLDRRIKTARDCVATPPSGRCRNTLPPASEHHAAFSTDAHGTAVAGVIASAAGNGEGIVGVAPGVDILALKACWYPDATPTGVATGTTDHAVCNTFTLAKAIQIAVDEGADILNLSLTGPPDPLLHAMVEESLGRGAIVVGAVPKESADPGSEPGFPASHRAVITVETLESEVVAASRQNRDTLFAPGENVLTTQPGGKYDFVTGSSFAAAHVTGLAALLLERRRLPSTRLHEILRLTSDGPAGVNACDALAELLALEPCPSDARTAAVIEQGPTTR